MLNVKRKARGRTKLATKTRSKKSKPGAKASAPEPSSATARPTVILAGRERVLDQIGPTLEKLGPMLRRVPCATAAAEAVDTATIAVVLATEGEKIPPDYGVRAVLDAAPGGSVPVFVLVPDDCPSNTVRRAYAAGATALIEWPTEALVFARLFRDLVSVEERRGKPTEKDRALARALQARLDLVFDGRPVRVAVKDGTAQLSGTVPTLAVKQEVERMLADVPGVLGTSTAQLVVASTPKTDAALARDARFLLRQAATVDHATLCVSAKNGRVILTGTAASKAEVDRALGLLHLLHGASGITNLTTISPSQKRIDKRHCAKAQKALEGLLPQAADVDVRVFGPVAVVSGHVPVLEDKWEAERIVGIKLPVDRIVNKIQVEA